MEGDRLVALATIFLVISTIASVWAAWKIGQRQEQIQIKNAEDASLFQKRAGIFEVWRYISTLDDINPQDPITPDVVRAVNALELIAICQESGILDQQIIRRTFRRKYIELYRKIENCRILPGLSQKTGRDLLDENPAAQAFYILLDKERVETDAVKGRLA